MLIPGISRCSDEHSGKVKSFMLDVLCPLITESDNVSQELLDIILINIVEPNKSARKNSYHLAKELIIKTHETLEQYVQQVSVSRPDVENGVFRENFRDCNDSIFICSSSIKLL